jgi:hypothetical protein
MRVNTFGLIFALTAPAALRAQSVDSLSLAGRSSINFGIGLTGQRTTTAGISGVDTHTTGEVGSFGFTHWFRPEVAITVSAAVLDADETVIGGHTHTNVVTPLLFGASYSPRALALSSSLRPYVSLAAGPYFHSVSDVGFGNETSTVESVAGVRSAIGANWFVASHFLLSIEGDYHAVSHFEHKDALTTNPSGFGMSFGFGFSWGGR